MPAALPLIDSTGIPVNPMPGPAPRLRAAQPRPALLRRAALLAVAAAAGLWAGMQLARTGAASGPAPAVEPVWELVGRSVAVTLYLDRVSLEREAALRRVVERQDLAEPDADGVRSRRYRNEYDCASRRHRIGEVTSYAEPALAGKRLFALDERGYWRAVPRGSLFERAFETVCADHGRTLPASPAPHP